MSDSALPRLCQATLERLPADVERPGYDRAAVSSGVVHIGAGAFHRAHQAAVFDALLRRGDPRWGIRAASLRSPAVRDRMAPQDCLYSLAVRDSDGERVRVIGAVREVLVAPERPAALVEALAAQETHLVTVTVTEKGFKCDAATGALLEGDPDVAADLAGLSAPRTLPGFLAAGLALRRERGLPPFTVIACDNVPDNGPRLHCAVLALAARHDPRLRDWIAGSVPFPRSMVDRIVPATDASDVEALARRTGTRDEAMVKTEPFLQWVIEERFAGPRPEFEAVGVDIVRDVAPWEEAKLRLLNGAHSAIAWLGGLAGIEYVDGFVARPEGRAFVERLWDEAAATLSPPPGLDVPAYRAALMQRFANQALQHRTHQIAMDGSQKLPQRLLAPIAARLRRGRSVEALALAVAAWMRWQEGCDDLGHRFVVDDPLASRMRRALEGVADPAGRVHALLSLREIFPPELAASAPLRQSLVRHLRRLSEGGAMAMLEEWG